MFASLAAAPEQAPLPTRWRTLAFACWCWKKAPGLPSKIFSRTKSPAVAAAAIAAATDVRPVPRGARAALLNKAVATGRCEIRPHAMVAQQQELKVFGPFLNRTLQDWYVIQDNFDDTGLALNAREFANWNVANGTGSNSMTVALGDIFSENFTLNGVSPFQTIERVISITSNTLGGLTFSHAGGDNIGLLLDNVLLTRRDQPTSSVPEPATAGLLSLGLLRRRKTANAA